MKKNNIDCFDINGGALVYKKSTTKKPINGKTLLTALEAHLDLKIAQDITKQVMENRELKVSETIRRKINK